MIDRKEKTRLQREMDTLQRNFSDLDQTRRREIEGLKDELKALSQETKRNGEQRDAAVHREKEAAKNNEELTKRLQTKILEFDSLTKDYAHLQQQLRALMSSEGTLLTEKEKLEA